MTDINATISNDKSIVVTISQPPAIVATVEGFGPQGVQGEQGVQGDPGADGADGVGVPTGGNTGQLLQKASNTDYDMEWGSAGAGDMQKSVYDPQTIEDDAFDQDNMTDGVTNKNFTATEKTKLAGIETAADVTDAGNVGAVNAAASSKTTPVNADSFPIVDSEAANIIKRLTFTNLKAFLKTYFDSLYQAVGSYLTASSVATFTNKTFNANDTGNSISNIEVADLASGVLDTDLSSVSSSDDTIPSAKATKSALDGKVTANGAITGATKTKITYDAKGLITAGADATQDDIGDGSTYKQYSATDKTKVGHLTVTQAVDLDAIESRVNALDAAVVLKGAWDASAGTFPGSGTAQAGDSYIVSVAGTVDGIAFSINDRVLAILDNASATVYATNWLKLDYTDQVLSVAGQTGAVTLDTDDVTEVTDKKYVTDAEKTKLSNLSGTNTGDETATRIGTLIDGATSKTTPVDADNVAITDSAASHVLKKLTWANLKATLKTYFDTLYTKATGAEVDTGTDDVKFLTPKAIEDSSYIKAAYADAKVADAINDSTTTIAPSQNAVFDALALKQPLDSDLTTIAGLTPTTDNFMVAASSAWASRTPAQAKTSLALVKADVGLGNVDNTADTAKPVSTAQQTALDLKANLASPTFTGTVVLPATTLGGINTLSENSTIALDPAGSADGKFSGITVTGIAGYSQAFGDLVYLDPTDSRWEAADGNAAAGADGDARGILGMVVVAGTDGNACTILLTGIIRADANFPALTVGAPVYVAETAGDIVVTQPTTTDAVIRIVGAALTSDEIFFRPDFSYTTHT